MGFYLGERSKQRLEGVHPDLVSVVEKAIGITRVDFTALEGIRTNDRQIELVKSGASNTMNSRHLTGHAVDLGAYVGGTVSWDWPLYFDIADAMKKAANQLGILVEWGGCWRIINNIPDLEVAVSDYVQRKVARGEKPLLDGPHFQLPWRHYPIEEAA